MYFYLLFYFFVCIYIYETWRQHFLSASRLLRCIALAALPPSGDINHTLSKLTLDQNFWLTPTYIYICAVVFSIYYFQRDFFFLLLVIVQFYLHNHFELGDDNEIASCMIKDFSVILAHIDRKLRTCTAHASLRLADSKTSRKGYVKNCLLIKSEINFAEIQSLRIMQRRVARHPFNNLKLHRILSFYP